MINIEVNRPGSSSNAISAAKTSQLSSLSAQSFTALLSEAFSETLSKLGIDPSSIKFTVQVQPSQSSATSQTSATNLTSAPAVDLPKTSAPAVVPPSVTASGTATISQHWYANTPADDAYWSQQPAAVQQLRGIDNLDERKQLGEQLASEGYSIDVPVMIWGWDAEKVTAARESYGYTWVPSANQQQVTAAPGVTGGGITPYNPNQPPSGSILV
jgi:hypothetical protein